MQGRKKAVYRQAVKASFGLLGIIILSTLSVQLLVAPFTNRIALSSGRLTFTVKYTLLFGAHVLVFFGSCFVVSRSMKEQLKGQSLKQWYYDLLQEASKS